MKNSKLTLWVVVGVAAMLGVGSAAAADLPPVYAKTPSVAVYNWTGFYVGDNVGGAWGSFAPVTSTEYSPLGYLQETSVPVINGVGSQSIKPSGFTGGFEAGYNWQSSNFVLGVEGDIESFHLSGRATSGPVAYPCCAPSTFTVTSSASTDWLGTIRGRVGVAENNWLFFATGGAAFTQLKGNFAFADDTVLSVAENSSLSNTKVGWTVGGGLEAGLSRNWSIKAEYLFVDFGGATAGSGSCTWVSGGALQSSCPALTPYNPFNHSVDLKANIVRLGVNYRFD